MTGVMTVLRTTLAILLIVALVCGKPLERFPLLLNVIDIISQVRGVFLRHILYFILKNVRDSHLVIFEVYFYCTLLKSISQTTKTIFVATLRILPG